jgi:hypothetical protein
MSQIACRLIIRLLLSALILIDTISGGGAAEEARQLVILTARQTTASFAVLPDVLAHRPATLFISIPKVVNPDKSPFQIFVYLERNEKDTSKRVLVGNFSPYPPDEPGGFRLSTTDSFRKLGDVAGSEGSNPKLVIDMRRMHQTDRWNSLQVTIAPPEWQDSQSQ